MFKKIICLCFITIVFYSQNAVFAEDFLSSEDGFVNTQILVLKNIQHQNTSDSEYREKLVVPEDPVEPQFKQIKFLTAEPHKTLTERIDRLTYGISTDIPPEYDHYGYEIRRYMKNILTPSMLNDPIFLIEQIKNIQKAKIILDYWQKHVTNEMEIIQSELDQAKSKNSARPAFKHNQRIANQFMQDQFRWINANLEFLEYLQSINGQYKVSYPFYDVPDYKKREKISSLYQAREDALAAVLVYTPFRLMIY
jgi:hypothetical protein